MKTVKEIERTMKLHHIASRRGYISRKSAGKVETYKGRFGEGYIILRPRWDTTNYVYVEYYINAASSAAEEIAAKIRESDEWNLELLGELCSLVGMSEEWAASDGETFESVAYKAAESLGVEI